MTTRSSPAPASSEDGGVGVSRPTPSRVAPRSHVHGGHPLVDGMGRHEQIAGQHGAPVGAWEGDPFRKLVSGAQKVSSIISTAVTISPLMASL